jgi:hypothetical protein
MSELRAKLPTIPEVCSEMEDWLWLQLSPTTFMSNRKKPQTQAVPIENSRKSSAYNPSMGSPSAAIPQSLTPHRYPLDAM